MTVVNFSIPTILDERIKTCIEEKGFISKAEFFRFLAFRYLDEEEGMLEDNEEIGELVAKIEKALENIDLTNLPSIEEQLEIHEQNT